MKKGFLLLETIISIILFFSVISVIYYSFDNIKHEKNLNIKYSTFILRSSIIDISNSNKKINIYKYITNKGFNIDNEVIVKSIKNKYYNIKNLGFDNSITDFIKIKKYKIYNKEFMVKYRKLRINLGDYQY